MIFFKSKTEIEQLQKGSQGFTAALNRFNSILEERQISARVSLLTDEANLMHSHSKMSLNGKENVSQ